MGITHAGLSVEQVIAALIGGKRLKSGDKRGDIELEHEGQKIFIESKKKTLNQTRPNKYITVVAFDGLEYYVIPPDDIIKLSANRRGQHTPDSLTCVGHGSITNKKFNKYRVDSNNLRDAIISAWTQGENNKSLKNVAEKHRALAEQWHQQSQQLLSEAINNE